MRIAKVLGTVTLSSCHPSFVGARLKLIAPQTLEELQQDLTPQSDMLVAWDDLGVNIGCQVAIAEGGEAAQPFRPEVKPVDCYSAALLDQINIDPKATSLQERK
ncbi:MAG: EutN/CcmL family microcompartment protein [Pirellulaceae bacterium]